MLKNKKYSELVTQLKNVDREIFELRVKETVTQNTVKKDDLRTRITALENLRNIYFTRITEFERKVAEMDLF